MSSLITEIQPTPIVRGQRDLKEETRKLDRNDAIQRRRIAAQKARLDGLQDDNFGVKDPRPDENPEYIDEDTGGGNRKKKQKVHFRRLRERKALRGILTNMRNASPTAGHKLPCYSSITANPPKRPSMKICSLCGNVAPYKCIRCEARCCSRSCLRDHEDLCTIPKQ